MIDVERLHRRLELALDHEWPQLMRLAQRTASLRVEPLTDRPAPSDSTVATVAADGGENRLSVDPIRIELIRVADSRGIVYFEEFIPRSLNPDEIIRFFFAGNTRFREILDTLDLRIDDALPRTDYQRGHLVAMLRELMEWAALLQVAEDGRDLLLLHDGLLRSVLLNESTFDRLSDRLESLTRRNGHLLAGIAKHSRVLSYLATAFDLAESFRSEMPGFAFIPAELEQEAAPMQYRWIGARSMGALCIARLDHGPGVPIMPVDVARWQHDRAADVMTRLLPSCRASFPHRGYPMELLRAHEHARCSMLECAMLESMLVSQLRSRDARVAERVQVLRLLGNPLIEDLNNVST